MARGARDGSRLDSGLVVACVVLSGLGLVLPDRVGAPVAAGLRAVLAPLVRAQQKAEIVRSTIAGRDSLLRHSGAAVTLALSAPELADENAQLRRLVGLGSRLQQGFVVAEAMQTQNFDHDFTLTISAGSTAGVVPGTPVVTADGLVGMVQSVVDPTMSFAISWAHPDFAVSAMSVDEIAFGIVKPHLGTGAERWLLELRGVPFRANLKPGTLIVTTGMGHLYPRAIPIGTVLGEVETTEKWVRTYLLKPSVLPKTPGPVLLLLPSRTPKDLNNVWTTVASADSAARSITSAGDSLARKAALDELAARRAAIDSTAIDSTRRDSTGAGGRAGVRPDTSRRGTGADSLRGRPRPDSVRPRPPTGPPPPLEFNDTGLATRPDGARLTRDRTSWR